MHPEEGVPGFGHGSVSPSMGTETSSEQEEGLCSLLARLGHMGLGGSCPGLPFLLSIADVSSPERFTGKEEHLKRSYRTEPSVPMAAPREVWGTLHPTTPST